ncbi:Broad specificity phosphatase PhoE [Microbacterium sp. ru370.1]|uniref:histidine phosphatase family protein n=1 Tax=unclassified Microbacterium TaxID=2609290 RepID=UPI00088D8F6D|nr:MULTISPECIES: histidine phosphatase family protein [unclassified Microbacterium]SDO92965.1 Broad specificity phosphatase PhoE [Microbacterium sp. ru370.1]SIT93282.1 Broad specificity phosphatase PhoE [Microbacterium sp. RU1D]
MPADRLHLVRHGEVYNPRRVLYGRLPGFGLSVDGRRMARQAAEYVQSLERPVSALVVSPLQRTRESAEPFVELFGAGPFIDDRVIEPTNVFEGRRMKQALANPLNWRHLSRPAVPSWGEPYERIVARMVAAMDDAWNRVPSGDVVVVSHQLPIWVTHLALSHQPTRHDPRKRRCELSSVTSFERREGAGGPRFVEVAYATPASTAGAVDVGAV